MTCPTCHGERRVPNGPGFPMTVCPGCMGTGEEEKTSPDLHPDLRPGPEGPFPRRVLWAVTILSAAWILFQVQYAVSLEKRVQRLERRCPVVEGAQ